MAERKRRYRLTYDKSKDKSKQPQGVVERALTDVQVERMRRGVEHPRSRLQSIELVEEG